MGFAMTADDTGEVLLKLALAGDIPALAALFSQHRDRLKRMVKLRLDRRLQGRVDASDVLQEAYLDLAQRLPEYGREPKFPLYLWMRLVTGQRLAQVHRKHLGAAMRNAELEVSIYQKALPQASTEFLASRLLGHFTSVSQRVVRAEQQIKLQETLNSMDEIDREILALRHFEELSNDEAAKVLEIQPGTASKRYIRALRRLKEAMASIPGMLDE
jgi:RNA polymerase sigma-70 factor, ECF subfamily